MSVVAELRALLRLRGFRKLFAVRLVSQAGDGMFQVGLASLLFFSPESQGTAAAIAGAFAVMLAPFTIVGPFAGVFLDRWQRRQVLAWGNAVRVVITLGMAALMLSGGVSGWIYALGLAALSVNRFLLAGLSAGLPRVVDGPLLLTANSLTPTLGAGAAFVGGGIGFVLGLAFEPGRVKDSSALVCAALVFGIASLLALRLGRTQLGPERPAESAIRSEIVKVARGLADGARYLVARRTPGQALLAMATHRFLYGVVFIASILIARNLLDAGSQTAGMATFAIVVGLTGLGGAGAMVLTPTLSRYTGPQVWIAIMLLLAAASQLLLVTTPSRAVVYTGAALLGLAAQGTKIAVDTIVQRDTDDEYRGRAFAFYDVLYNAAFVGAAALAAFTLPDTGWSRGVFVALAVAYALAALVIWTRGARTPAGAGDAVVPDGARPVPEAGAPDEGSATDDVPAGRPGA
ncbi:MFS family permease [Cellulosimicrobium cellulans]|uniref:MFS transporter n=1 Tax=Cellulosimicrobium cellulans TaxID=1710 RepID=A0A1Y0HV19_CELCE|nr:MFS transporter [Cellulosimicrobium cellulans]ARU51366.1 MFS transporter [Cellulosimicrobium cellulans]MBM7817791.1 MFS family permease [Cellulosimicrobium cellulans]